MELRTTENYSQASVLIKELDFRIAIDKCIMFSPLGIGLWVVAILYLPTTECWVSWVFRLRGTPFKELYLMNVN